MRKLVAISIFFLITVSSKAQFYGNTWVNYSQKYHKIKIFKEGIFRIDYNTLSSYYDVTKINPKNFQLFLKGKEQAIFVNGEGDNTLDPGDYVEFYANPSMREIDSSLYTFISYLPNPYLGLFNDTINAFLTSNSSVNNKRFILETDTTAALYPTANYFYSEKIRTIRSDYQPMAQYSDGESDPRYTKGEGYGEYFAKGSTVSTSFTNLNPFTGAPLPCYVSHNFSGASKDNSATPDHETKTSYTDQFAANIVLGDVLSDGFEAVRQTFTFNVQNTDNNTNISVTSVANPSFATFNNVTFLNYINFTYPHNLNLNNQSSFQLLVDDINGGTKSFFNFSNFNLAGASTVLLYDITNGKKITTKISAPMLRAIIPNNGARKICYLAAETQTINVSVLTPVNQTGYFTDFKNPTATKPFVIIYNKAVQSGADAYKIYRQSMQGGSYNVSHADIDELYDQFAWGVAKHPAAIRNFARFLKDSLPVPPQYVLLIGKAIGVPDLYPYPVLQPFNLVPTMGYPSSDNLLTSALSATNNNALSPEIPIGRLAANTNSDVTNYLDKVVQHESTGPAEWKKKVVHFVGGNDDGLINYLSALMSGYEQTIKDTLFGAQVLTFKKNTTAPIQLQITDSIKNTISHGAALITFFGHGSQQGFDAAIDDPEKFDNQGKYPFVVANSCFSGNIHIPKTLSVSEKFVFSNQRGSIGFLATTSLGFVSYLNNYTSLFYRALGVTRYNKGIGDIIKEACIQNSLVPDSMNRFTSMEMTLHGDPSLKISNGSCPDYILKNSDVSFDLKKYTDSIGVRINLLNLGSAKSHSIIIKVERYFANGDSEIVFIKKLGPYFKDSILFYRSIDFNRGIGLNRFKVFVDFYGEVSECIETNNNTIGTVDVFIPGGDILPVYPYKYAIVPRTNTITLKASTTDPFAPSNTYKFQLDTCDKFTSPLLSTAITSKGGVIEWNVTLPINKDSIVYFWRVSRDSISPAVAYLWKETSFQMISTKRGWGQAHFNQFKSDAYQFVSYKKDLRKFLFENNRISISCRNAVYPHISPTNISYFYNNITMTNWSCAPGGWNFAFFDYISGAAPNLSGPVIGPGAYNNCICSPDQILHSFDFGRYGCGTPNSDWKVDIRNFLNNIPDSSYVLGYSVGFANDSNARITTYSSTPGLVQAFQSIGSVSINTTPDTVPYIIFGKKGLLNKAHEVIGTNSVSTITLNDSIDTHWNQGYIASEIIGPSFKWNSLHWRVKSVDAVLGDTTLLKVVGIRSNGQIDTLAAFTDDSLDILDLAYYADANVYPYLKLVALMKDNKNRTSPQLKRWQVLYDEAPECALNPLRGFEAINANLQEGDVVTFKFPIENIGVKNFDDSLLITYWVENEAHNKVTLPQKLKAKPFVPGQIIFDSVKVNTYQLTGNNSLWIFVNPLGNTKYQREQYQFNNIGRYGFTVSKDVTNPLLDVTFDGIRILNGDIVSAKPNIFITVKDENKFLQLNDTAAFTVMLQSPTQGSPQRIYFGNNNLIFTPASLPKNSCSINFNPSLLVDGKYSLSVTAKDRTANRSGVQSYQIQFEVDNKPTVTNVLNYPNPFTTSTRFVFTLTGSEVPEVFTIQIMTVTGKLIKEITRADLGNLHIGRNITEYAWDGRDNFGDRLANGVYLYKVVTKLNGDNIEKSGTTADKFFTKEFGKMVIMR